MQCKYECYSSDKSGEKQNFEVSHKLRIFIQNNKFERKKSDDLGLHQAVKSFPTDFVFVIDSQKTFHIVFDCVVYRYVVDEGIDDG